MLPGPEPLPSFHREYLLCLVVFSSRARTARLVVTDVAVVIAVADPGRRERNQQQKCSDATYPLRTPTLGTKTSPAWRQDLRDALEPMPPEREREKNNCRPN